MTDDPWPPRAMREFPRLRYMGSKYRLVPYLAEVFTELQDSVIVLSYSSNAVPGAGTIEVLLREVKDNVEVRLADHTYTFGTHSAAQRRAVSEYLFIGRYCNQRKRR